MANIGGDGTTTVRKLEGFQDKPPSQKIAFHGLRNTLFRLIEHPIGHFKWPSPQSQAMMSIRLPIVLHTHTTYGPSHFLAPSIVSIDHVRDKQRTGEYCIG